jgi:hypothetical protein
MSELIYGQKGQARQWSTRRSGFGYYRRVGPAAGSGAKLAGRESQVSPPDAQQFAEFKQAARALRRNGADR